MFTLSFNSNAVCAATIIEADANITATPEGTPAKNNTGYGLFDNAQAENTLLPFSREGLAQNKLFITYINDTDKVQFSYHTVATTTASEVGMKPLLLEQWNPSKSKWETIYTTTPLLYNTSHSSKQYEVTPPAHQTYYRIKGYHYAKINGKTYTLYNESEYIWVD